MLCENLCFYWTSTLQLWHVGVLNCLIRLRSFLANNSILMPSTRVPNLSLYSQAIACARLRSRQFSKPHLAQWSESVSWLWSPISPNLLIPLCSYLEGMFPCMSSRRPASFMPIGSRVFDRADEWSLLVIQSSAYSAVWLPTVISQLPVDRFRWDLDRMSSSTSCWCLASFR